MIGCIYKRAANSKPVTLVIPVTTVTSQIPVTLVTLRGCLPSHTPHPRPPPPPRSRTSSRIPRASPGPVARRPRRRHTRRRSEGGPCPSRPQTCLPRVGQASRASWPDRERPCLPAAPAPVDGLEFNQVSWMESRLKKGPEEAPSGPAHAPWGGALRAGGSTAETGPPTSAPGRPPWWSLLRGKKRGTLQWSLTLLLGHTGRRGRHSLEQRIQTLKYQVAYFNSWLPRLKDWSPFSRYLQCIYLAVNFIHWHTFLRESRIRRSLELFRVKGLHPPAVVPAPGLIWANIDTWV